MSKRMLIDAAYREETRVVILDSNQILNYDYETSSKQQLKGNIYLAKVTRVEASLQAAFVDYGQERHGFLPFSEIHPDYYQIPVSDRERVKEEVRKAQQNRRGRRRDDAADPKLAEGNGNLVEGEEPNGNVFPVIEDIDGNRLSEEEARNRKEAMDDADDFIDEDGILAEHQDSPALKKYKIQEVIKRNQVILVQVIKEERGNKGAALTSYISLAGRYCVVMPNSDRQGGISRRIMDGDTRRNLRKVIDELDVPEGMSVIVRTAGSGKNDAEIKRDYEYLSRLWNTIREHTLTSKAPCFIHAEGDLLKRCVRDNYDSSIDEILVQGDEAYSSAKQFVKLLIPNHVNKVKHYKHKTPLFSKYKIEEQLAGLYRPVAQLKSGGYIVMNPTEALTSIDVNSGRATSERNIEETALKTNIEAAVEVARQIRLRDISGLIVVDFIDMAETRHRIQVERALRDAMQLDRAKIQMGRISASFGLLEMSRQRMRPSLAELNTIECPQCQGAGMVRSAEPIAVMILRAIANALSFDSHCGELNVFVNSAQLVYILNEKRRQIAELEESYDVDIFFHYDVQLATDDYRIEKTRRSGKKEASAKSNVEKVELEDVEVGESTEDAPTEGEEKQRHPRRKRTNQRRSDGRRSGNRRRRGGRPSQGQEAPSEGGEDKSLLKGIWRKIMESS